MNFYDRQGNPIIGSKVWALLFEDMDYRRVAETTLPSGKWVSTVWMGIDHRFTGDGPPLIFETMVFPSEDNPSDQDMERYSTEEQALEGHERMCRKWSH